MILIADSGGSKTDWALVSLPTDTSKYVLKVRTQGLNPFHQSKDVILKALEEELIPALYKAAEQSGTFSKEYDITEKVKQIAFYGAGCTKSLSPIVGEALAVAFPSASIKVESDLLGAAHAVCGHEEGIACILGTGANSCLYDGEHIVANIPPLGYILGDEGSGAVLGKMLLNGIFKGDLSAEIRNLYLEWSGLTYPEIIDKVYRQPLANRFLAGSSKFIKENLQYAELEVLVRYNFDTFFKKNILKYTVSSIRVISAVGGIASAFEEQLRASADSFGYQVGKVLSSPIDGLIEYYS
nr:ATPase [uncultured Prevotella sp.]